MVGTICIAYCVGPKTKLRKRQERIFIGGLDEDASLMLLGAREDEANRFVANQQPSFSDFNRGTEDRKAPAPNGAPGVGFRQTCTAPSKISRKP